jgi:hypothetical protein
MERDIIQMQLHKDFSELVEPGYNGGAKVDVFTSVRIKNH